MSLDRENLAWSTAGSPASTGWIYPEMMDILILWRWLHYQMHRKCLPLSSAWTRGQVGIGRGGKDLEQMFETYNGTTVANATKDNPNAITDFEKANRAAWDRVVSNAGGTIMNEAVSSSTGDTYWACREASEWCEWIFMYVLESLYLGAVQPLKRVL